MQLQFHHILQQSHHQAHPRSYTDNFNTFCFFQAENQTKSVTMCIYIHTQAQNVLVYTVSKDYLTFNQKIIWQSKHLSAHAQKQ